MRGAGGRSQRGHVGGRALQNCCAGSRKGAAICEAWPRILAESAEWPAGLALLHEQLLLLLSLKLLLHLKLLPMVRMSLNFPLALVRCILLL